MNQKKIYILASAVLLFITVAILTPSLFEDVDASDIVVIQSPTSGELAVYTEPGLKWQGFGKVTIYPRRSQFSFSSDKDQGKDKDESLHTRFNDGGDGTISGTLSWAMPLTIDKIIKIHRDFGSIEAIDQQLVRTSLQKVIYNVGPTMSSTESAAEKRPEIPRYIDDQLLNGPYSMKSTTATVKDIISGGERQTQILEIAFDANGKAIRESTSPVAAYGISLLPVSIGRVSYEDAVEAQIRNRQDLAAQVQAAVANARKAEQDAITVSEQGKASAAKAKWDQETINAKLISEAEQRKQVAELDSQAAQLTRQKLIYEGEGEATKRKLIMEADGALDKKLSTYKEVNLAYAEAIKLANPGAWVPHISLGGTSKDVNSATALMDLLTAKTAQDLSINNTVRNK